MANEATAVSDSKINYNEIVQRYPWIIEKEKLAIISPDCDGFLCGLLMNNFLNWKIVGFYDGKILILKDGLSKEDCVFLDMDIYRKEIKSVGHHMVMYNRKHLPSNWRNYDNCLQACNLRQFDFTPTNFKRKYPLGTIHLLLGILDSQNITPSLPEGSGTNEPPNPELPLLFADGIWINQFDYMENVLEWISYLGFDDPKNILFPFLCDNDKIYSFMKKMNIFLRLRDDYNANQTFENGKIKRKKQSRTGDNLRISNKNGDPINLIAAGHGKYDIEDTEKTRVMGFINVLSKYMGWTFNSSAWLWSGFKIYKFEKRSLEKKKGSGFDIAKINKIYEDEVPFSLVFRSGTTLEYTVEI